MIRIDVYGRVRKKSNEAAATIAAMAAATRSPVVATPTTTTTRTSTRRGALELLPERDEQRGDEDREQGSGDPGDGVGGGCVMPPGVRPRAHEGKRIDGFLTPDVRRLTPADGSGPRRVRTVDRA